MRGNRDCKVVAPSSPGYECPIPPDVWGVVPDGRHLALVLYGESRCVEI